MVEAAGIEPASEKGLRKETTCLVRLIISTVSPQTDKRETVQSD